MDSHLESDYEDKNGGSVESSEWLELDDWGDDDEDDEWYEEN